MSSEKLRSEKLAKEASDCPVISVAEMREADRRTIEGGVPSKELMRRAAQGVYDEAADHWPGKRTLIICGSGNNGGDGYALAEIMHDRGLDATVYPVSEKFSDDGSFYYNRCLEKGVPIAQPDPVSDEFGGYDIYVDCIFGTGFKGEPREPQAAIIRAINAQRDRGAFVISVDINSGMNGDTGEAVLAVVSDLTVSIGFYKHGFFKGKAADLICRLVNTDIGIQLT